MSSNKPKHPPHRHVPLIIPRGSLAQKQQELNTLKYLERMQAAAARRALQK